MPPADGLLFAPARAGVAAALYGGVAELPLLCPHGHVDPWLLAEPDATLGDPARALVSSDHYVFRMLHSQGVPLEELGVGGDGDPRAVWQRFAEGYDLFAGTPTGLWLALELRDVFGVETALTGATAQMVYDELDEKLRQPEFAPRALFERFGIEVLCTTDSVVDDLTAHEALRANGWDGRVLPTLRADPVMRADAPDWPATLARLGELVDTEIVDFASLAAALAARLEAFRALGSRGIDVSVTVPRAEHLPAAEADAIVARGLRGAAEAADADRLSARLLLLLAELARDTGVVLQLHAGSLRNHHADGLARLGRDIGADIPVAAEWTRNLGPLLNAFGDDPALRLVAYTLDESTLTRELAPLAGYYPALRLGAPWWFLDSPVGMRRFLEGVSSICGLANAAGFVDDTRAFPSIPARHEVWRRVTCDWLAERVEAGELDEEQAHRLARALAYDLAREGYRLDG